MPAGITGASLWIYNPSFVEGKGAFGGNESLEIYPKTQTATGGGVAASNGYEDAPSFYFSTTYTLYSVSSLLRSLSDSQLVSRTYPPYDGYGRDLALHGCTAGSNPVYDPYWQDYRTGGATATSNSYHNPGGIVAGQGCFDLGTNTAPSWDASAPAPCYLQWCTIATNLAPGTIASSSEATGLVTNTAEYHSTTTDGSGTHLYSVKICPTSGLSTPLSCGTGAAGSNPASRCLAGTIWRLRSLRRWATRRPIPRIQQPLVSRRQSTRYTCLDLGCIQTAYAGRTVNIRLFDPGDGSGDIYIGVVAPSASGATVSYPSWVPTTTIDGDTVVHARFSSLNYNAFDGLWLDATVSLPATYTGNCQTGAGGTGWFQLVYASANGTPGDWVGVSFTLVGSPLHLVPPILG